MVRIPSLNSMDGEQFLLNLEGTTNRYGFFRRTKKDIKGKAAQHKQERIYGYQTKETFLPIFKNQDYPSMKLDAHALIHCQGEDNCLFMKLEAFELIEALENGELNGELKSIAERLQEDDNPVLMVVKLKSLQIPKLSSYCFHHQQYNSSDGKILHLIRRLSYCFIY